MWYCQIKRVRRCGSNFPVALVTVCLLAGTPVSAQNIVTNSNLAENLLPWTQDASAAPDPPATGTASWTGAINDDNTVDATGSGWIQLTGNPGQPANASMGIRQCVTFPMPPVAVSSASYGAHFLAPATGNPIDGLAGASVEVRFYSDADCLTFIPGTGGSQGFRMTSGALSDTVWYEIGDSELAMPAAQILAASAEVRVFVRTQASTDNGYQIYFDRIWMSLNGTVPVELLKFEIE